MRRRASPDGSDFHCCRSGLVVHDAFFRFVIDMGGPGPDLILPPDYKGDLNPPVGGAEAEVNGQKYFVARSGGYVNWLILRGFLVDGKPDDATAMFKNGLKVYPLALAGKAPDMKFINASSIQEGLQHDPREQLLVLLE